MDHTDKRNALISRLTERIFISNAATWPKSQMGDLCEKAFMAASEYAEFMIDQKNAFEFNPTEQAELINALDTIDTRLMGIDEKSLTHLRSITDGLEKVVEALDDIRRMVQLPAGNVPVPRETP